MSATFLRRAAPRALLIAALAASPAALAADKPATAEGAQSLQSFFSGLLPEAAPGEPALVTVKPDGSAYVVTFDFQAMNGLLKGAPASYEPAVLVYRLYEQDDGNWRFVLGSFPKLVVHSEDVTSTFEVRNFSQTLLFDPAIAWWLNGSARADGGVSTTNAPDLNQTITFGPAKAEYATTVGDNGAVSSTAKETFSDLGFKMTGQSKEGQPVNLDGRFESLGFNVGFDGLKTRKLFDALSLVSANRDNLGPHADALKGLLHEIVAPGLRLAEGAEGSKGLFTSPFGAITLAGFKIAGGLSDAGPDSAIDLAVSAEGLSLPVGLAPPGAADLTPSKIDVSATLKGIDISAAASTAIDRLRLDGKDRALADEDMAKVAEAFLSAGPLRLELQPSHIAAPAIDADVQGEVNYATGHVSGSVTIRMRNFDKTMAAVKNLGPEVQSRALPGLAMAKGLAKSESDGSLSWIIEVDQNRSISVNGIPLGKAPG